MTRLLLTVCTLALAFVTTSAAFLPQGGAAAPDAGLTVGNPAPPFALMGSDGRVHKLSDFLGKQVVVLAWFAKAFSGG